MENKDNNEQNSLNPFFIPQFTNLLYQQNPIILYQQLNQNNTYNAFSSSTRLP